MRLPAVAMALTVAAQPATVSLEPTSAFKEKLDARVQVSGTTLVGITRGAVVGEMDLGGLGVGLPSGYSGALCLALVTRDGRYSAWQTYRVRRGSGTSEGLGIRSEKQQLGALRGYQKTDLGVRAQLKPECDGASAGTFLAASWPTTHPEELLSVQLNVKLSRAAVQLLASDGRALGVPETCTPITAGARTAFDHTCLLRASQLDLTTARSLRVDIFGTTGSRHAETYPVRLIG